MPAQLALPVCRRAGGRGRYDFPRVLLRLSYCCKSSSLFRRSSLSSSSPSTIKLCAVVFTMCVTSLSGFFVQIMITIYTPRATSQIFRYQTPGTIPVTVYLRLLDTFVFLIAFILTNILFHPPLSSLMLLVCLSIFHESTRTCGCSMVTDICFCRITLLSVSVFCVFFTLALIVYMYKHKRLKVFKVASPIFLAITLLGCGIMYLEVKSKYCTN